MSDPSSNRPSTRPSNRPPVGTSPQAFFEDWLPRAFADSGRPAPSDAVRVRATLSGAGGGVWDMQPNEGALEVSSVSGDSTAQKPSLWIRQSVTDFRAALEGD